MNTRRDYWGSMAILMSFGTSDASIEALRGSTVRFLKNYLTNIRENLENLEPILHRIFDQVKEKYSEEDKTIGKLNPSLQLKTVEEYSRTFLQAILGQHTKMSAAKQKIDVEGAIFIAGAGLSFESGMPLSNELKDILRFCGAIDYVDLRNDPKKCYKFKKVFREMLDKKSPGISHQLIAENFPNKIKEIIRLNWDDLVEKDIRGLPKEFKKVNKNIHVASRGNLWKFHGDVEEFDENNVVGNLGWVFPDEDGYVFKYFEKYMSEQGINEEFFSVFVVGYSEEDKRVKRVIETLENSPPRPTFRIGMNLGKIQEDQYLLGPSPYILDLLFK